jgi:molybdopterin converting factor small subunit
VTPSHAPATAANTLTVRCRLFARYAEILGTTDLSLVLAAPATVADAVAALRKHPGGENMPARPLVAVALEHAPYDRALQEGDELGFLPPVAGG